MKPAGNENGEEKAQEAGESGLIEFISDDNKGIKFRDCVSENKFSRVFTADATQNEVYSEMVQPMVLNALNNGNDGCFFTLGPSNSGKSFSVYGTETNPGMLVLTLTELFELIGDNFINYDVLKKQFYPDECLICSKNSANLNQNGEYGLSLSVFEIYNDRIRDLTLDCSKTANQSLDIITDFKDGKIKPNKLRSIFITNINEAKLVLSKSIKRRAVSATGLNMASSRSHLFIYINIYKLINNSIIKSSRLTISDLAGSERSKTAKTEGKNFKEGNYTNQSLTELGRCLSLMNNKKFDKSILRTNKLTRLLLTDLCNSNHNEGSNSNSIKILLTLDPYSNLQTILQTVRYIQPLTKLSLNSSEILSNINSARSSLENGYQNNNSGVLLKLNEEISNLKKINDELSLNLETSENSKVVLEIEIRQEIFQEFEEKFNQMEKDQQLEINKLKEDYEASIDKKLEILSKDYEERISKLKENHEDLLGQLTNEYEEKISKLKENHEVLVSEKLEKLTNEYEEKIGKLKETHEALVNEKVSKLADKYEAKISDLKESQVSVGNELEISSKDYQDKIDKLRDELKLKDTNASELKELLVIETEKIKSLQTELVSKNEVIESNESKLKELEIQIKQLERKDKKHLKKIQDLTDKLLDEKLNEKRMSSSPQKDDDLRRNKKQRSSELFDDLEPSKEIVLNDKENNDGLFKLSPIKIKPNKKPLSSMRKSTSPKKSILLSNTNILNTNSTFLKNSPRKRKINNHKIFEDDEEELD